jgi:hypothetical protein
MRIKFPLSALFIAFAFTSAAHADEDWKLPTTKEECLAKNGAWEKRGMPGDPQDTEICVLNAPDAGKQCSSMAQCLSGWCKPSENEGWKPAGEQASGICKAFMRHNGCVQGLEKGIIVNIPCIM